MLTDKRILTINDSPTVRLFLRDLLRSQGAYVDEAETAQEGLVLATGETDYDLILLDLVLPDASGMEVLQQIRQTNEHSTIVMLTGKADLKTATAAVRQGADGYLDKQTLSSRNEHTEFLYALEQALEHRAGLVAQKQLQEIKADFYSMVTHDLRNPTSAILTALDLIADDNYGSLTGEQRELLEIAQRSAEKLYGLINDYLDFAKIDAGYLKLEPKEVDVRELVQASVHLVGPQINSKKQHLVLELPPETVIAVVDGERIKQILDNLISNAIKYTPEGGRITSELSVEEDQLVFRVSDTGRGIKPEQLPALFTKYHRVPGEATRGIFGSGLGLLIVKEIAEAHGGLVSAESEGIPGRGSTFTVKIPRQPATQ